MFKDDPFFWRVSKVDESSIPLVWGEKYTNKIKKKKGRFWYVWPNITSILNRNIIKREISDDLAEKTDNERSQTNLMVERSIEELRFLEENNIKAGIK